MADMQQDGHKPVPDQQNYVATNNCDPKNVQELTTYEVHNLAQTVKDMDYTVYVWRTGEQVQALLQGMQEKFQALSDQILGRIDEMGNRIDDLEKNIGDLMTQAGVDGPEK